MISSRERLWEPQFKETVLTMSADTSYAKTVRFTNILLARELDSLITRTIIDLAWREGQKAGECYEEKRNTILPQYGINAETGELEDSTKLPDNVINPNPGHSEEDLAEYAAIIGQLIETYNSIYTYLKDEAEKQEHKQNYMTVPAAIKELEKIEMIKGADNIYRLDHAVTATQKAILKAFDITAENVNKCAKELSSDLQRIDMEMAQTVAVG